MMAGLKSFRVLLLLAAWGLAVAQVVTWGNGSGSAISVGRSSSPI